MTHDGERPVEHRLREALGARADTVTVRDLRPADPPGSSTRRPVAAVWLRRLTWSAAGLAGAAAAVTGYLVLGPEQGQVRPVPPAAPAEIPSPTPSPQAPAPSHSAEPSPIPSPPATRLPSPRTTPTAPGTYPPSASPSRPGPPSTAPASASPTPMGSGHPSQGGSGKP
ncbi:hypothetical protein GCM10010347_30580 [Streptomyces cirratus]|uniref:Uncharacterized protein n=1 Tax=Streptomyces cirratus TaxID=68187 RepID=A0ABQ3EXF2_9ACTN|nr:hypothetical protein [Streptomyces cirratus]GHB58250.1 hypothetical protein GCM10010347_30580 [Streptomyces cirratus]